MRPLKPIANRALLSYSVLVFLIAWGAVVLVVGPAGITGGRAPENWQLLPVLGATLLGPAVAGLFLIAITDGRAGLRELWGRHAAGRWTSAGTPSLS